MALSRLVSSTSTGWIAFWTGTINLSIVVNFDRFCTAQLVGRIHQLVHLGFRYPVEYPRTFSPVFHQPGIAQDHQVLGDIRLAAAKHSFQVTDTLLTFSQGLQDHQPGWVHQGFKNNFSRIQSRHIKKWLGCSEYIQYPEYIIGRMSLNHKAMYHLVGMTSVTMVESQPCSFLGQSYGTWTVC
jgi:hypothetical protein